MFWKTVEAGSLQPVFFFFFLFLWAPEDAG